jgi:anti-anti-sigma factor
MDTEHGQPALPFALSGELCIQTAAEQRLALATALDQAAGRDLALDLHDVHGCDSAGVQLLLATRLQLQRAGGRLHLEARSAVVRDVLRTYGLQALFDSPPGPGIRGEIQP